MTAEPGKPLELVRFGRGARPVTRRYVGWRRGGLKGKPMMPMGEQYQKPEV